MTTAVDLWLALVVLGCAAIGLTVDVAALATWLHRHVTK
jgi:hypothetical protein